VTTQRQGISTILFNHRLTHFAAPQHLHGCGLDPPVTRTRLPCRCMSVLLPSLARARRRWKVRRKQRTLGFLVIGLLERHIRSDRPRTVAAA